MKSLIPDNIKAGATHIVFLNNHIDHLENPPTKVESILLNKGVLYVGEDGKMYFTPKAIQYYVSKAVIQAGVPEDLLMPGINPFGFHCIDGRVTLPKNFENFSLSKKLKSYTGTIPGGGAGMVLIILSSLIDIYGEADQEVIKSILWEVLEQNKRNNPDNYKIQWHTDKHTEEEKEHTHTDKFKCGCGFIMRAIDDPVKFGVTPWATELLTEILTNPEWAHNPDVLGEHDKHLETHKERAAILARGIESSDELYQNYIMSKQVDFSPFLSQTELNSLTQDEVDELNQMAFTGNFRAFGVKGAQIASILEDIIVTQDKYLEKVHLTDQQKTWLASKTMYFAPKWDKKMSGAALHAIFNSKLKKGIEFMTTVTKMKLSDNSPLAIIDIDQKTNTPVIIDLHVVE